MIEEKVAKAVTVEPWLLLNFPGPGQYLVELLSLRHSKAALKRGLFWYKWGEFGSSREYLFSSAEPFSGLHSSSLYSVGEGLVTKMPQFPAVPSLLLSRMLSLGWMPLSSYMWWCSHSLMVQRQLRILGNTWFPGISRAHHENNIPQFETQRLPFQVHFSRWFW